MSYDKNSFLSGVAVGRQLKGWGRALADEGKPRTFVSLETVSEFSAAAVVNNSIPEAITALGWVSVGEVVEFSAAATVSEGLPGTIGVRASLEVQ